MESGPSRMYQAQTVAFNARSELMGVKTDSTPETPPTHTLPNVVELSALKQRIVSNLPTNCVHCEAIYPPNSFLEHKGSVMAYCKLKGACGRSLVLFAGVEMNTPVYTKICPFKAPEIIPAEASADTGAPVIIPSDAEILAAHQEELNAMAAMPAHAFTRPNVWRPFGRPARPGHGNLRPPTDFPPGMVKIKKLNCSFVFSHVVNFIFCLGFLQNISTT